MLLNLICFTSWAMHQSFCFFQADLELTLLGLASVFTSPVSTCWVAGIAGILYHACLFFFILGIELRTFPILSKPSASCVPQPAQVVLLLFAKIKSGKTAEMKATVYYFIDLKM
jgi:hypothetical protein